MSVTLSVQGLFHQLGFLFGRQGLNVSFHQLLPERLQQQLFDRIDGGAGFVLVGRPDRPLAQRREIGAGHEQHRGAAGARTGGAVTDGAEVTERISQSRGQKMETLASDARPDSLSELHRDNAIAMNGLAIEIYHVTSKLPPTQENVIYLKTLATLIRRRLRPSP